MLSVYKFSLIIVQCLYGLNPIPAFYNTGDEYRNRNDWRDASCQVIQTRPIGYSTIQYQKKKVILEFLVLPLGYVFNVQKVILEYA